MNRLKKLVIHFVWIIIMFWIVPEPSFADQPNQSQSSFSITILHTNDSHGHIEQFPLLATVVKQYRRQDQPTLLLHAGDVFTGTLFFTAYKGKADVEFMNNIGYDGMTIGNHEFDLESETLADFITEAKFPMITSNIDFSKDETFQRLFTREIKKQAKGGKIYPAIIQTVEGEEIGIIGVTTEQTPHISNPHPAIHFLQGKKQVADTVERLELAGINKIILLSHLGLKADKKIAKQIDGIDCIIGGHSHSQVKNPIFIKKDEPTVIVQAGEYLEHVGVLQVSFNEKGVLTDYEGHLIKLDEKQLEKDPKLTRLLKKYEQGIEPLANTKVGKTTVHLQGNRRKVRTRETNLGNLIADSFLWKAKQQDPKTEIALINAGSIRTSIPMGTITVAEIRNVLPFGSELVLLEIKGKDLVDVLESSVGKYPNESGEFLHISGMRFSFHPKREAGSRIEKVEIKNQQGKFQPLDPEQTYHLVTTEYLAKGKEGYDTFAKYQADGKIKKLHVKDYDALTDYVRERGTVSPKKEGRISTTTNGKKRYIPLK
ncbi:bifunctional metallophosphatase/5'-nucleotidase [Fervidibacillus halotolerans]|uniref:5'-nucleotidase C-terminal domain-containing protein n=1 Tax=Fervidibacillus halotolerans TaxID=2980027 RepID=A0A9E8RY97_9BACI|nr:5'-nucleotidase C-terminal domain-containing protein [Fervidibacillus halotolerans]WAA12003.1 5'-nucleotidase C-terminal domain-containing protein [Fervidibacillus halotolerans]